MLKKWIAGVLMCAALLFPNAQAQTYAAVYNGEAILFDESGALLCGAGEYTEILPLAQGRFAAKAQEGWYVLDETGEALLEIAYEDVYAREGMLFLKKDGLYAAADMDLRLVTPHAYTQIVPNGEGGYLALKTEPNDDRGDGVYLLDGSGAESATGTVVVYGLNEFSCGRSAAVGSGGKKTGYLAPDGTWAITAQYGYGAKFVSAGLAAASADSGVGVIDTEGNWVISPKFESVSLAQGNSLLVVCAADGRIGLMNAVTREAVLELESGYVRTRDLVDMALVTQNGEARLYATDGQILASWDASCGASVRSAGEGYLLLSTDEGEFLLDDAARQLCGPYAKITPLDGDTFAARTDGGYDLIGADGGTLAEVSGVQISPAGEGIYLAWSPEGARLIDRHGKTIVELARNAAG